jgi:hypothetical protein
MSTCMCSVGTWSTRCIILGYSTDHKVYRCIDLTTNNIVISRHVVFYEVDFPFSASPCAAPSSPASPTSAAPCSLYDFGCAPCGALNSTRTTRGPGIYDYSRTTHGSRALPAPLLAPPLGYARVTDTASTSAVTASEGRTGGTSGQSSSDDHSGEAGFLASGRQTHPIGHLGVNLVVSTLLRPRYPSRSELMPRHGRRVFRLDWQQHMGSCPSPCCLQRHRQIDFQSQVQL